MATTMFGVCVIRKAGSAIFQYVYSGRTLGQLLDAIGADSDERADTWVSRSAGVLPGTRCYTQLWEDEFDSYPLLPGMEVVLAPSNIV